MPVFLERRYEVLHTTFIGEQNSVTLDERAFRAMQLPGSRVRQHSYSHRALRHQNLGPDLNTTRDWAARACRLAAAELHAEAVKFQVLAMGASCITRRHHPDSTASGCDDCDHDSPDPEQLLAQTRADALQVVAQHAGERLPIRLAALQERAARLGATVDSLADAARSRRGSPEVSSRTAAAGAAGPPATI